ncbi:MAG: LPS export ABC transporter periplasmic protein LptC [Xanthomonadales bacterium]|nr:LPS export ABC transporter periplasmic protein LptC [Xanthomonadales bacterium]
MIHRKTWHGIFALAVLAIATALIVRSGREPGGLPPADLDTRLSYALWDFSGVLLNKDGQVNVRVDAPMLRNKADSQVGTVENPRLRIMQDQDEWYISADSAIITGDREFVSLVGRVDLVNYNLETHKRLNIQTRDVMLTITPRLASTDASVSIQQDQDVLDAVGMKLDMINQSYQLLSQVRARYATPY